MSTARDMALTGDHPLTWDEYIGQVGAKRQLQVAIASAKARGARLGHTLVAHPDAGIGKTSLALLVAMAMGARVEIVSGQMSINEVRMTLAMLDDGDILILEECHRLFDGGKKAAEWMLHLMQHDILLGPLGAEDMPRVTLLGTTTDGGRVPEPIQQRFEIKPKLVPYTDDDGAQIALSLAGKILVDGMPMPDEATIHAIARAAANRPRTMRDILCKLRDLVVVGELEASPAYDLSEALAWEGLTEDGLTTLAQQYMTVLLDSAGIAGVRSVAEQLGEIAAGLQETERLLIHKGFLQRTKQGRALTLAGQRRARSLVPA